MIKIPKDGIKCGVKDKFQGWCDEITPCKYHPGVVYTELNKDGKAIKVPDQIQMLNIKRMVNGEWKEEIIKVEDYLQYDPGTDLRRGFVDGFKKALTLKEDIWANAINEALEEPITDIMIELENSIGYNDANKQHLEAHRMAMEKLLKIINK